MSAAPDLAPLEAQIGQWRPYLRIAGDLYHVEPQHGARQ